MTPSELAVAVGGGDRRALAKAITLVESERPADQILAQQLMAALPVSPSVLRLGVAGAPGAGKSTFIDALGQLLVESGRRPAVVAYDPSGRSGGSVLGDKTRMGRLAHAEAAFIRPSPNRRASGGVGNRAFDVVSLCEAAGYDPIIVETVGIGQSEIAVTELVDLLLLVVLPHAGDEIQALKKGLLEHADAVLVNKADGERRASAEAAARQYESAFGLLRGPAGEEPVLVEPVSALEGTGIAEVWAALERRFAEALSSGRLARERAERLKRWFGVEVRRELERRVLGRPAVQALQAELERELVQHQLGIGEALERLMAAAFPDEG
jgi:LAO/AO transport system kinase